MLSNMNTKILVKKYEEMIHSFCDYTKLSRDNDYSRIEMQETVGVVKAVVNDEIRYEELLRSKIQNVSSSWNLRICFNKSYKNKIT